MTIHLILLRCLDSNGGYPLTLQYPNWSGNIYSTLRSFQFRWLKIKGLNAVFSYLNNAIFQPSEIKLILYYIFEYFAY